MIFLSFHWKAGMWLLIPLLPPSSGRRWRVAPEVGFVLFAFGQPPALRASPFHGKGVDSFHHFSRLPLEGGGAQRRKLASLSFAFGQPPALRASPFHGKGVDALLIPLLPPSSGRRRRVAPEVGFALFQLQPPPCPSGIPLPWEGGRWVTHPASPSFLWKEVAHSAGGWLRSLFPSANPRPATGRG